LDPTAGTGGATSIEDLVRGWVLPKVDVAIISIMEFINSIINEWLCGH
jgi:hypothetical protein